MFVVHNLQRQIYKTKFGHSERGSRESQCFSPRS